MRFAKDKKLNKSQREGFASTASLEDGWRGLRTTRTLLLQNAREVLPQGITKVAAAKPPTVSVFDCQHTTSLPGNPIANPSSSSDATTRRAFEETTGVAKFFRTVFGRNSLDNTGMGLLSSVHYSVGYNNAFWNGSQMTYGDGDGLIFVDFTKSSDVIAHELMHGITQYTAQLAYADEAGGLNESMSDVFGSMYRQWRAGQTVANADWLIGKEIMGPSANARGYTCLRDMATPDAKHCLAPQITNYSQYSNGMDPHESSGVGNLAFFHAATALGGNSWDKIGKVWYQALVGFPPNPTMSMAIFAKRTRSTVAKIYKRDKAAKAAVNNGWKTVGL